MSTDVSNPRSISCHRRGGKLRGILALCREESSIAPGGNAGMENQLLNVTLDVCLSNYKYSQDFKYIHSACQVIRSTSSNAPRERLQLVMLSKSPKALLKSPLFSVVARFFFFSMHACIFFFSSNPSMVGTSADSRFFNWKRFQFYVWVYVFISWMLNASRAFKILSWYSWHLTWHPLHVFA